MSDPASIVGGMALGHVLPEAAPKPLIYAIAIAFVVYLFRKQLRRVFR